MPSVAELLERESTTVDLERGHFERLTRRRNRKERNRRISSAVLAAVLALASFVALTRAFHTAGRTGDEPAPKPPGIFSEVGGWVVYGGHDGIWAVDPSHPGDPGSQIQLSSLEGIPLAWSSDGSKLLISRGSQSFHYSQGELQWEEPASRRGLFVLNADGTETHLVRDVVSGASFSPDGTTVVFAPTIEYQPIYLHPGIFLIDADGGVPRLLVGPSRRYIPDQNRSFRTTLYFPTFSPDGTQIAYFDGFGDNSHSLRVVNADGTDPRVLIQSMEAYRISNLAWSPDGTRLAFGLRSLGGIYTIGVDGSGLTLMIPDGQDPYWSPDGSRMAYLIPDISGGSGGTFEIAALDGTHVQELGYAELLEHGYAEPGPWNPLVQPASGIADAPAASEGSGSVSSLLAVAAFLTLVGGSLLIRRRIGVVPRTRSHAQ